MKGNRREFIKHTGLAGIGLAGAHMLQATAPFPGAECQGTLCRRTASHSTGQKPNRFP